MGLPVNIEDLIERRVVENARVEYKAGWNAEPILHTLCAFANDIDNWGGGYIIIGIEAEDDIPKFPVQGLKKANIDKINKELLNRCNLIEPRYEPVMEQTTYHGKEIIVLWAPGGPERPYKCPVSLPTKKGERKGEKAYYIRKMSSTIRANELETRELFLLGSRTPFDDRPNMRAEIADLRPSLLSEFLHSIGSDLYQKSLTRPAEEVASDMKLIGGPPEARRPLNVGLMFFNERPDNFFPYTYIDVVDKPDPTGDGMTEKRFTGPPDRQLEDALNYIKNYIIAERVRKISGRAEAERTFNYPYDAVEEALANAVYHRSYQVGEPVTVMVTPEGMEIASFPRPDRTITDEDLANRRLVSRRYRNRRIGDFLKELKLAEGRNTGIPKILKAMRENGSPLPEFRTDAERSYFTVILPVHEEFLRKVPTGTERGAAGFRSSKQDLKTRVLALLREQGDLSGNSIALALGYRKSTANLTAAIRELVQEGKAAYLHPDSPRSRNQRICLVRRRRS